MAVVAGAASAIALGLLSLAGVGLVDPWAAIVAAVFAAALVASAVAELRDRRDEWP
jgi:hypothetical protein